MFSPMNASGLTRNSETSIWSSDTPDGCTRAAMRLRVSPRRTRTSSLPVVPGAAAGAAAVAGAGVACGRGGAGGGGDTGEVAAATGGAPAAVGAGEIDGGTAAVTGAWAVRLLGGSSSSVYSRTSRPVAQLASTMTSTKGSSSGRSLDSRRTLRPSGLCCSTTWAEVNAGLYSTPAAR